MKTFIQALALGAFATTALAGMASAEVVTSSTVPQPAGMHQAAAKSGTMEKKLHTSMKAHKAADGKMVGSKSAK